MLAKDPNNEYMQRMVMLNKAALKDFTGAEEAAKKLFSHADAKFTATDYTTYGDILGELKRPEDAVAAYTKAYELNPEKNKQILANISSMYTDLEDYQKAAEYMQKFVDAGDASLNDYFILSNRYKNLGVSLPEGSPERIEAANNGIKYVDMAIESAANKGPLYRNKATLMMVRDGAEITPALVETYQQMLAAYDENPENKGKIPRRLQERLQQSRQLLPPRLVTRNRLALTSKNSLKSTPKTKLSANISTRCNPD